MREGTPVRTCVEKAGAVCYLLSGPFVLPSVDIMHQIQVIMLVGGILDGFLKTALGGSAESRKLLQDVACKY